MQNFCEIFLEKIKFIRRRDIYQEKNIYIEEAEEKLFSKFLNDLRSGNHSYIVWKLPDKIYIYLYYLYYTRIYTYISG